MTPREALAWLVGQVEPVDGLVVAVTALQEAVKRDEDVRELDEWAKADDYREVRTCHIHDGGIGVHPGWTAQLLFALDPSQRFAAASPAEARSKAAEFARGRGREGEGG